MLALTDSQLAVLAIAATAIAPHARATDGCSGLPRGSTGRCGRGRGEPSPFDYREDRTPTHGYAATREAAMAVFAKSWRRE